MVDTTFDRISRFFAERRLSHRQALAAGRAGIATAVGLGAVSAQEATPVAEPSPEASDGGGQYLFVQSYATGAITPAGDPGRYTVTLEGGVGQTIYFANRPSRDVGAAHVFIDDCPDTTIMCVRPGSEAYGVLGRRGMCWRDFWCHMCFPEQHTSECTETFDKICQGRCQAEVQII